MSNVIDFQATKKKHLEARKAADDSTDSPGEHHAAQESNVNLSRFFKKGVWTLVVVTWPFVRIVFSIDVFWQFLRAIYYWDTPTEHAGLTFLVHFTVFAVLTGIVAKGRGRNGK